MDRTLFLSKPVLQSVLWPKEHRLLKQLFLILGSALLLGAAAQISIPLQPVPLTFQSVTVLLIAMTLGAQPGVMAIMMYLVMGCLGLPVFANFHAGVQTLLGPTGGYLIGFLPAALVSGYLAQRGWAKSYLLTLCAAIAGTVLIFGCGVVVLAQFTGWTNAYLLGVKPFLVSEPLKLLVLAFIAPRFWQQQ